MAPNPFLTCLLAAQAEPALAFCATALAPADWGAEDDALPWTTVVPAAGADGLVPTLDGRRIRMPDAAALAAALQAQQPMARVDYDHNSERVSPTFCGSTAAQGWATRFRAVEGRIEAVLDLNWSARADIRSGRYRYLSPGAILDVDGETITGLSSIALVNDPNMALRAPAIHSAGSGTPSPDPANPGPANPDAAGLEAREAAVAARERSLAASLQSRAREVVERAVADGRAAAPQVEYHLAAINGHAGGIERGIALFEASHQAADPAAAALTRRVGPAGSPASAPTAPAITVPAGWRPPTVERSRLHARILDVASSRSLSYMEAARIVEADVGAAGGAP